MKHLLKKNKITIRGAGGGSMPSGGTSAPPPPAAPVAVQMYPAVLAPPLMGQTNYISSFSYAEIIDLISDGPIEGLVNQDNKKVYGQDIFEGIFLNGVPVKETSRINSEEYDIDFLKQELKNLWGINEGGAPVFLNKDSSNFLLYKIIQPPTNNPFLSGNISLTSYHPQDSLFQLVKSLNLNLDSIKLAQKAFDAISINDERPFLTIIDIPTLTVPIPNFKFDQSIIDTGYGLDLEIANIGQYIYFTVDSENLNSNQYSEIPRTFIKHGSNNASATLKNNIPLLPGYSGRTFNAIKIYIWSVYDEKKGIKDVSKAIDRYLNNIRVKQRLPGQYNYNLIKSEFKNGAEVQYPLQSFKNVEIDIQHDKELIGPFKILNNQYVNSARCSSGGGVTRLTNLNTVAQNAPITELLDNESSDDVRYVQNWPIEYDPEGKPVIISDVIFNYGVFDQTSKNRTSQPAIPVTHYIDNNNVEEVYVSLTLNSLSDTNHIDLVSEGFGTKPNYAEDPYDGTLTYAEIINQNAITNVPAKVSTRYIAGTNISPFIPWFSVIFPIGILAPYNIDEAKYPFVKKFAEYISQEVAKTGVNNVNASPPSVVWLFGVNIHYLYANNLINNQGSISLEDLNSLLDKYYWYSNISFERFLSTFANGKLIGYSKIVNSANPFKAYSLYEAYLNFPFKETEPYNVFANLAATAFGNGIYLTSDLHKITNNLDYVFEYQLTPKEVSRTLSKLTSTTSTNLSAGVFNRKQQITAGTRLPTVVSIRIDTGYETNENSNYVGGTDFFSYKFDIYGLASDTSKIDIGRRRYDFVRGQTISISAKDSMYAATVADSSVKFHLFKITECGKIPNYYISNTRDFQYNCVDFSSLSPASFVFPNKKLSSIGLIPVYCTTGVFAEITNCFSGYITGIILNGSPDYICEICTLNECGLFGLQTSGYLSLANFEKEIIGGGGFKIPEVLKDSIFDDYKLNMSTALPELKKIQYLNFPAVASPYNFIECSSSLDPLNNCYGIDTYKFNSHGTNTCVQVCSFNIEIFNSFPDNLKVAATKVENFYFFSIFRVNGDISFAQAALNNFGYKYVILNIGAIYQNYILVYLPSGKNTTQNVYDVVSNVGLARTSYNPPPPPVGKLYVHGRNAYNQSKYFELGPGFMEAYHSEMDAWYTQYGNWNIQDAFDSLIRKYLVRNPDDDNDNLAFYSKFIYCHSQYRCQTLPYLFRCEAGETIVDIAEAYSACYNGFIYLHNDTNLIQSSSLPREEITTKNSNVSLGAYVSHQGTYFKTNWEQDVPYYSQSPSDSVFKNFLLSISNDQNIPNPTTLAEKFKKIKWIARSNSASYIKVSYGCGDALGENGCFFTFIDNVNAPKGLSGEYDFTGNSYYYERKYNYQDYLFQQNIDFNCLLKTQGDERLSYITSGEFRDMLIGASDNNDSLVNKTDYFLNFELAASEVFSVNSQPRNELSSPVSTDAISVTAKFWVLDNECKNTISVIFVEPNKSNCWVDLQDGNSIAYLPLTKFLSSYNGLLCNTFYSSISNGNFTETVQTPQNFYLSTDGFTSYVTISTVTSLKYVGAGYTAQYGSIPWGSNGLICACVGTTLNPNNNELALTNPGGIDYFDYDFLTNNNVPSLFGNGKNLRIISTSKKSEPILKTINDLLKSSSSLGDRKIPADAFFATYSASPKVYKRWVNTNNIVTNTYGVAARRYPLLSSTVNNPKTQILNISYYEVALSNFSQKKEGLYSNDGGQQILLPPPRVDTSGSPIRRYVKITKLSYETLSPLISKRISVGVVTEIIPQTFSYPFSAIIGTKIDARSFSQMPARSFHCKLKKVLVPSNYYPNNPKDESDIRYDVNQVGLHKIYDGDWDGTFKLMWTDNPAWILMDMLVNKRYGLGNHISPDQIDIWELYQVARWCDGVNDEGVYYGVPDSYGGVEPRHTFNALISEKFNVFDMINQIASVFRGHVYYMNSLITFDDDRPKPPIGEFTNADVKDGLFNYTNLKKDDEFTAVEVAFVDAKNDYKSSVEYVENADAIRKRGVLKKQMNAFGVTSRGQARRIGKHFLHQTSKENLNVSFTTDMKALLYKPGDLITIHDEVVNSYKNFGSIKAIEEVQHSGDLFKVVIDQALNSGIYDTNMVTLYSAMTKPTYSDMEDYLERCNDEYRKVTIDFLQPLFTSIQKAAQEIRNKDPRSFGIRNGITANQLTYGYKVSQSERISCYPSNPVNRELPLTVPFNCNYSIPEYLTYLNSGCRYYNYPYEGAYNHLTLPNDKLKDGKNIKPIFRIGNEVVFPYADVGFGCLAAPNDYLFPPFLGSISGRTIAQPCRVFGKDCLFVLMNSGSDYEASRAFGSWSMTRVLRNISYIKYPCSDMEVYTSRISGLPVYVETGNNIKNEVRLRFPNVAGAVELCRSNNFLFTGSIAFRYCTYQCIVCVSGRHQLCDYTKPFEPVCRQQHEDLLSKLDSVTEKSNLGFYAQPQGFVMSTPHSPRTIDSEQGRNFSYIDPIRKYKMMSESCHLSGVDSFWFSCVHERYTVSGLSKIPQNHKIFFPALMYFCVSQMKSSYYLSGIIEKTAYVPIRLEYVENETFSDLVVNSSLTPKLRGHWAITVGNQCSDILELDWVGQESEKLETNIYEILNKFNCFRFSQFSGIVNCEPIYFPFTEFNKAALSQLVQTPNPNQFCDYGNLFTKKFCYDRGFYKEPFEQRSGQYSGFNNLYLFSQMTGTSFVLHYPKDHIPAEEFDSSINFNIKKFDVLPKLVSEPLNQTYLSGIRELLCQCFNLGKPHYPLYCYDSSWNQQINQRISLMLDNFQNFNTRMIVDFTGYDKQSNTVKCDYSYFQRTFAYFRTGIVTPSNLNFPLNGYNTLHSYKDPKSCFSFSSCFSLCADHFPPFKDADVFKPLLGEYLGQYTTICCTLICTTININRWTINSFPRAGCTIISKEERDKMELNPFNRPSFTQDNPVMLYSFARCFPGYRSYLNLKNYIVNEAPNEESVISYSNLIENDRPSIESFCIYSYITGYNKSSGFDEGISTNTYTEIYLCKTNQFGVTKDSVRNGLTNFCVGSLYSLQILNKTAPTFKIMSINENYINEYNIFATQYKEEKFLEIEENVQVDSLENTFNALYYYTSASRLTQKNEPLRSPLILSIDYIRYLDAPNLYIKWKPSPDHIEWFTLYRIYVQSPSKQTPNLQIIIDQNNMKFNEYFEYYYQGDGVVNPLKSEIGTYAVSIEAFHEKDGVYYFSIPAKQTINILSY